MNSQKVLTGHSEGSGYRDGEFHLREELKTQMVPDTFQDEGGKVGG